MTENKCPYCCNGNTKVYAAYEDDDAVESWFRWECLNRDCDARGPWRHTEAEAVALCRQQPEEQPAKQQGGKWARLRESMRQSVAGIENAKAEINNAGITDNGGIADGAVLSARSLLTFVETMAAIAAADKDGE